MVMMELTRLLRIENLFDLISGVNGNLNAVDGTASLEDTDAGASRRGKSAPSKRPDRTKSSSPTVRS